MAPLAPRPLPPPTADVVFPPNDAHPFLEECASHPFLPRETGFPAVNAWWLAELSLLAYSDEARVAAVGRQGGLADAGWSLEQLAGGSTTALLARGPGAVVVAFRGTEVPRPGPGWQSALRDLATDADLVLEPWPGGGRAHRGFARALDSVWAQGPALGVLLDALAGAWRRVWFTGHSLGAALATLCAARWRPAPAPELAGVYTFGSPRVGDPAFAAALRHPVFRFVNNADLVPHLPPPLAYKHVGQLRLFDADGRCRVEPDRWSQLREAARGEARYTQEWLRAAARGAPLVPGQGLVCHAPLYYALLAWNACAPGPDQPQ